MNSEKNARVDVLFTERSPVRMSEQEQEGSYCASGYLYLGQLTYRQGEDELKLEVQTGGWMNEDSPFKRAGLCPLQPVWGEYDPQLYPDTAFPALEAETTLGTLCTGKRQGFRVPDPPGTGRSALMVHASSRRGSEGCISTPRNEQWLLFCKHMEQLHAQGIESIPLRVAYACPPPEHQRCLARE